MTCLAETLAGRIVLSVATAPGGDEALFAHLEPTERARLVEMLAELHLRKIDLADEVLILDVEGYIGPSTARELAYARAQGKCVRFLRDEFEMKKGPIIR